MILKALLILSIVYFAKGANVLFFFGLSTYSHRIAVWPLAEKLAEMSHNVTFIQPFKPKSPNPKITEFFPKELEEIGKEMEKMDFLKIRLTGGAEATRAIAKDLPAMGVAICESFLKSEETQMWLKNSKFDLVVIDSLLNDCGVGIAKKFNAKFIIYGTTHPFAWWSDIYGMPVESSWIPDLHYPYQYPFTFWAKIMTTLVPLLMYFQRQFSYYPELDRVFRTYLDPDMPSIALLEQNASLLFTNTHFSEELARSLPPLVIPIGGLHCEDSSQKLSKELEKFINESGDRGFIYISFGSAAKISQAPKEFRDIFFKAVSNSKTRIVWKYEADRPAGMPSHVFTDKWMPQQAILSHPKIRGFLTHGGLLGIQEAVWHGVPLLACPIFAEQDYNSFRVERTERGILLDVQSVTTEIILDAFERITTDPKYKRNMQLTSKLFKDRPHTPIQTAIWWTEYVLRHEVSDILKPLAMHQTWYERRLLDVWGVIAASLLVSLFIIVFILKKILRAICGGSKSNANTPAKSNSISKGKAKKKQ